MFSKIFSFVSLMASIAAFVVSGAFFVYRVEGRFSIFPALLLLITTFSMVIICTFNHYHAIMSKDRESDSAQNNDKPGND